MIDTFELMNQMISQMQQKIFVLEQQIKEKEKNDQIIKNELNHFKLLLQENIQYKSKEHENTQSNLMTPKESLNQTLITSALTNSQIPTKEDIIKEEGSDTTTNLSQSPLLTNVKNKCFICGEVIDSEQFSSHFLHHQQSIPPQPVTCFAKPLIPISSINPNIKPSHQNASSSSGQLTPIVLSPQTSSKFPCPLCGVNLTTNDLLIKHIEAAHYKLLK
ncbi:hypothetical protein ENUP19_0152G0006 [Entamoeba nuttalli]|uniref:Zinc finger, c2h2 type domain containing protein n=2 Tax=Entamoeba nuttalli TaxID=412467 RepID=K2G548_ENTNP|nr:zinc finger, c2h2 type domain containing protein [Entamoeba nuttalli P19]EKE37461.1 zinc finger, c2h2 type domain containing protein [Entamoeba nuttalli P19]|eukprot:XP_008860205.1 zinc finger, c2h2 type domain containing protein [Entamoeba nuttalli P19]